MTPQGPLTVQIRIYNSAGEQVYAAPQPLHLFKLLTGIQALNAELIPDQPGGAGDAVLFLQGPDITWTWDGHNAGAQSLGSGVYLIAFEMHDSFNHVTLYTQAVSLIRAVDSTRVDVYNGAGELVWHQSLPSLPLSYLKLDRDSLVAGRDSVGIRFDDSLSAATAWDGLNSAGQRVSSGVYTVMVSRSEAGHTTQSMKSSVVILNEATSLLNDALAGPSPLRIADKRLRVRAPSLQSGDRLSARLYTLSAELVMGAAGLGPDLDLALPGLAAGVYLLELRALSTQGMQERRVLKLCVVR